MKKYLYSTSYYTHYSDKESILQYKAGLVEATNSLNAHREILRVLNSDLETNATYTEIVNIFITQSTHTNELQLRSKKENNLQ